MKKENHNKMCKICGDWTEVGFNINFELTPICESCANSIFIQQAHALAELSMKTEKTTQLPG